MAAGGRGSYDVRGSPTVTTDLDALAGNRNSPVICSIHHALQSTQGEASDPPRDPGPSICITGKGSPSTSR